MKSIWLVPAFLCVGCAGPMTPFGAVSLSQSKAAAVEDSGAALSTAPASIRFSPERQFLHGPTTFSVTIDDPNGVAEEPKILVSYNGLDMTRQFLAHAQSNALDPDRRVVKLTTHHLRLLPVRENRVKIAYWPTGESKPIVAMYQTPICSAFESNQMIFTVPEFDPPLSVLESINQDAASHKLNPYFVAALVAQESGFDPQALSHNKALGLTQVTSLGEAEIIKRNEDWPRYPGLDEMPLPVLKLAIISGTIHSGNEWRLDPARSIEGGIEYLTYLGEYWSRPDKRHEIETRMGPSDTALSEVMLASYNSGAARVSDAFLRSGRNWLQDDSLTEARRYVRRVVSYCDHFEHGEE